MTPYASLSYFGFLLYPALPTILMGLTGRLTRWFLLTVTMLVLGVQYGLLWWPESGTASYSFFLVAGFALYTGLLAKGFLRVKARPGTPKWAVNAAVALALFPLTLVKLQPFIGIPGTIGFLGISYLTFRSLDVILGIQDGLIKELPWQDFLLYVLFFPTVSAGPVDRYKRFVKDLDRTRTRADYLEDVDQAVRRIFRGFLYKFIIAYLIKLHWMDPAAEGSSVVAHVSYMYAYSLYLFFDFAGYSAFAIGVGYLFGIRAPENFDGPFLSQNIRDFWNRWHMSLSVWMRDHVYMRFVMTATRRKWIADKHIISYIGLALTMGLMGIWHGLQWHYIVYGLYHGALMVGFEYLSRWNKTHKVWGSGPLWRWGGIFITFNLVCFGLLIFSGHLF